MHKPELSLNLHLNRTNMGIAQIEETQAAAIAKDLYQLEGDIISLPGEVDFNFRIISEKGSYLLKIGRPDDDLKYIEFQQELLNFICNSNLTINSPKAFPDVNGTFISKITDASGKIRIVRLLSWMPGRLWSSVNPHTEELLNSLGEQAGMITKILQGFDHPVAQRSSEWDIAQANWTYEYVHLFNDKQRSIIEYFQQKYKNIELRYQSLRKSVVHNDVNDNNIIVSNKLNKPKVTSVIDYGDAVYTQVINDLAITIAYAVMNKPDVLSASLPIIKGYNKKFPLQEKELELLYTLVAMRLVISVIKSAINSKQEPDNKYLLISEKPAWEVLEKWKQCNESLVYYSFREVCGFTAQPNERKFIEWADKQHLSLKNLFPNIEFEIIQYIDMRVGSTWLGNESEYNDNDVFTFKLNKLKQKNTKALIAGGYLETRPLYCTDSYKNESNCGPEYRTVHLGLDFWVEDQTPVHAPFKGKVFSIFNNVGNKDYGPTLILEHLTDDGIPFFSLYGHLSKSSLKLFKTGQSVKKDELIAYVGNTEENGNWVSHLHFQLILDMLGKQHDFPGVTYPQQIKIWSSICPNPNLFFKEPRLEIRQLKETLDIISYRKKHLGKGLSLSYNEPLNIVRGSGSFLIDNTGRKYLDTVNNVAHVGHEHPRVVKAGQEQMAILNTNSRYLHENINEFAQELLNTFPDELSVAHIVNSGSESIELALRMTRAFTGQKDMIAVEIGYHGNSTGCIDISSYKFDGKGGTGTPEYTHIVPLPDSYRGMYQGEKTGSQYAAHIQMQIDNIQSKGRNIAGFICESIISCGGQIELPENYLQIAYEAVREAGGLCIADEVQVGCGRVGNKFWAFQQHDVIPDIVTIGKPIGNGHPLAVVVCTKEVAEAFANGMEYFNTFGGNPVSCAIGREVLNVIKEEKLQQNALKVGNFLKSKLINLQKDFPLIGDIRGQGLFLGIELSGENKKPLTDKANYLVNRMKEFGILMSTDGKDNNVIKIKPPMVFSKENAEELLFRLKSVLSEDFMKEYNIN